MVIQANSRSGFLAEVDGKEFQAACISIAKQIDAYVGKNEVPLNVQDLAIILNHACKRRCDDQMRAVVMMLMISVKYACQLGWFPQGETQKLLDIIDSMWNSFSSPENVTTSVSTPISLVLQVIERFYPFLKLGQILVSFEAKPESNILVKDFEISEKITHSPKQMVGLLVVRTGDISKSNCIVHPQEVSFLLNGKGIDNRVNISMDSGPQLPTNLTALVNVGANLLQTVGCFGGSYFIVIAYMDIIPLPDKPLLKDYVHSEVIESNSDCDIIEGASKIFLSCPISRTRIKLPVKGHSCKHLQCFDFWNYVKINMRRPSWRCPHCNQSACYTEIRVDQNMMKILKGVEGNAAAVVISADGSWRVVTETDENVSDTTRDQGNPNSFLNFGPTVLDLTRDENEMETSGGTQVNEQKPLSAIQGLSNNILEPATNYYMLNPSSASIDALPELPQIFNGQFMNLPQVLNTQDSAARQALPTSSPQHVLATNTSSVRTSIPISQSSVSQTAYPQFQGSHVECPQFQGSHVPSSQYQGSHVPSSQFQGSHVPSSQFQGSHVPSSQYQGSHVPSSQFQGSHVPSSQFQGSHVARAPLGHTLSTSDLMDRWRSIYGSYVNQNQLQNQRIPMRSMSPQQQRPMPTSITHPQNSAVNYGGSLDQRPMQRSNPSVAMGQFSAQELSGSLDQRPMQRSNPSVAMGQFSAQELSGSLDQRPMERSNPSVTMGQFSAQELSYLTSRYTENWRPQTQMRGSIEPGSTAYDHMIIRPTRPPVQAQAQTLPPPQPTAYNGTANEIAAQAFLRHQSYPVGVTDETQGGMGSLPIDEGVGLQGSFWSMPPESW